MKENIDDELTSDELSELDTYFAYYTKDKEVGYLSMKVDLLVDKCIQHQMYCFVLNMVHRELMAAEKQLLTLKEYLHPNFFLVAHYFTPKKATSCFKFRFLWVSIFIVPTRDPKK